MKKFYFCDYLGLSLVLALTLATVPRESVKTHSAKKSYPSSEAPSYDVVDLDFPEGAFSVDAKAISPNGQWVAGFISTRLGMRAFTWNSGTFYYCSKQQSIAWGVNDSGEAVGETIPHQWDTQATLWRRGKEIKLFENEDLSIAQDIDNAGNIYGVHKGSVEGHERRAFVRNQDGTVVDFDAGSDRDSFFHAANPKKQVALTMWRSTSNDYVFLQAVLCTKGSMHELAPLQKGKRCTPLAVNDDGYVVGMGWKDGPLPKPVIWKDHKPILLNTPQSNSGYATGINNSKDIVGSIAIGKQFDSVPFLMHKDKFYDLNAITGGTVKIEDALGINDAGVILAEGNIDGRKHAFLLKPKRR